MPFSPFFLTEFLRDIFPVWVPLVQFGLGCWEDFVAIVTPDLGGIGDVAIRVEFDLVDIDPEIIHCAKFGPQSGFRKLSLMNVVRKSR